MKSRLWLGYALTTMVFWGVWGAFTGIPAERGFPETLIYCVWALTMIPPAIIALKLIDWKLEYDRKSVVLGLIIGFLGAGGQMILFHAVTIGPTYLIFPIISLSPIITIGLSYALLEERTGFAGAIGILLALIALPLFNYSGGGQDAEYGSAWFVLAFLVLVAWGLQAYFMKLSNRSMRAESIFFYMTVTGLMLVPMALYMTDYSQPINWSADGPALAAAIQILNAIGALCLVYAFRYGKALVVSPMTNAGAPLMTALIALVVLGVVPSSLKIAGIVLALTAAVLLAVEPEEAGAEPGAGTGTEPGVEPG
ncbi:MAG: EamA family transporter [Woeseiaceae bacterium]